MKRFFYLSSGLFFLALTLLIGFHIGQRVATAQGSQSIAGFSVVPGTFYLITDDGNVYWSNHSLLGSGGAPTHMGNYWGGGTPVNSTTWGGIKTKYQDQEN